MVFAGQRADGFHVDLGSIFDLGDLRPLQGAYNKGIPPILAGMPGVNGLRGLNVHTLALQVPISDLTVDGSVPEGRRLGGVGHRRVGEREPDDRAGARPRAPGLTAVSGRTRRSRGWATR